MAAQNTIGPLNFSTTKDRQHNPWLDPSQVKLDTRDTRELFHFLYELSGQFWYYDHDDEKKGDWRAFFESDLTAILAIISQ